MIYGITPNGFVKMRQPEIRAEIVASINAKLSTIAGQAISIETLPNSITGPWIDTFAEREAAMWDRLEAQYLAMYPNTAEGVSLDNALGFTGNKRLTAAKTKVYALIKAPVGVVVPAGSTASSSYDQQGYTLLQNVTVSNAAAAAFRVEVGSLTSGDPYTVTVNAQTLTYVAPPSVTTNQILAAVTTFLQAQGLAVTQGTGVVDAILDGRNTVTVTVSSNLRLTNVESVGVYEAITPGAFIVTPGDLVASATGVTSIRNVLSGVTGRVREEDNDVRRNYELGPYRLGRATIPAIKANLLRDVTGVTEVKTIETLTGGVLDGRLEIVIDGGDDQEIRNMLLYVMGASTTTVGTVSGIAYDSEGEPHTFKFTRPQILYTWVSAKITLKTGATISASTFSEMQAQIVARGLSQQTGELMVQQDYIGVMKTISDAIAKIDYGWFTTADKNYVPVLADYVFDNIQPDPKQKPVFAASRIRIF